jgi:hypothetical protein
MPPDSGNAYPAPMFALASHHWGLVRKGQVTFTFKDDQGETGAVATVPSPHQRG